MLRDSSTTTEDKSHMLLVDILPRKGETVFDEFVAVLRGTERQEHVVRLLLEPEKRSNIREYTLMASDSIDYVENEIDRLVNEEVKKLKGDLARAEMTVVGLRNKVVDLS